MWVESLMDTLLLLSLPTEDASVSAVGLVHQDSLDTSNLCDKCVPSNKLQSVNLKPVEKKQIGKWCQLIFSVLSIILCSTLLTHRRWISYWCDCWLSSPDALRRLVSEWCCCFLYFRRGAGRLSMCVHPESSCTQDCPLPQRSRTPSSPPGTDTQRPAGQRTQEL